MSCCNLMDDFYWSQLDSWWIAYIFFFSFLSFSLVSLGTINIACCTVKQFFLQQSQKIILNYFQGVHSKRESQGSTWESKLEKINSWHPSFSPWGEPGNASSQNQKKSSCQMHYYICCIIFLYSYKTKKVQFNLIEGDIICVDVEV